MLSFVLDATGYDSEIDGDTGDRKHRGSPRLKEVFATLSLEFIDDLVFYTHKPRLRLRRIRSYNRWTCSNETILRGNQIVTLSDECLDLAPFRRGLFGRRSRKPEEIEALVLTDTKDRLIRVLFVLGDRGVVHLRLDVSNAPNAYDGALWGVRKSDCSVIRCWSSRFLSDEDERPPRVVLDLLLQYEGRGHPKDHVLLDRVMTELASAENLEGATIQAESRSTQWASSSTDQENL